MGTYYTYNGTILPALPVYDTAKYPYAAIIQVDQDGVIYQLFAFDKPIFAENVNGSIVYRIDAGAVGCLFMASFMSLDTGWVSAGTDQPFPETTYTDPSMMPIWTNHNITFDDGTIQFYASTPVEYNSESGDNGDSGGAVTVNADLKALSFTLGWLTGRRIRKLQSDLVEEETITGEYQSINMNFDPETLTVTFEDNGNIYYDTAHNSYKLVGDTLTINNILTRSVNEYVINSNLVNAYLYNGVRLPALPVDTLSSNQYAFIVCDSEDPNVYYLVCKSSQTHITTYSGDEDNAPDCAITELYFGSSAVTYEYNALNDGTYWTPTSDSRLVYELNTSKVLLWSNYDVRMGDNVYLTASEPKYVDNSGPLYPSSVSTSYYNGVEYPSIPDEIAEFEYVVVFLYNSILYYVGSENPIRSVITVDAPFREAKYTGYDGWTIYNTKYGQITAMHSTSVKGVVYANHDIVSDTETPTVLVPKSPDPIPVTD